MAGVPFILPQLKVVVTQEPVEVELRHLGITIEDGARTVVEAVFHVSKEVMVPQGEGEVATRVWDSAYQPMRVYFRDGEVALVQGDQYTVLASGDPVASLGTALRTTILDAVCTGEAAKALGLEGSPIR